MAEAVIAKEIHEINVATILLAARRTIGEDVLPFLVLCSGPAHMFPRGWQVMACVSLAYGDAALLRLSGCR